ncbi:3-(3-hydroxy-phenyl)propionate/3-hydroxycinnamic acid hydroxylase [Enhygromyxa salina]|uniref:3-(3-hydroxy-phenyl)propionate/3-hydroxycinnamic acid hydroxylase n=1 Tax=Enhygromyxa salina TaxID=215803 RepID=A0A2S9XJX7_9BACT|nr:NAD(P)/FAD-dependent oxidoreductase [Enhygromyxa salina]PRP93040.1 3-(3-hydroxy-phenyl)propionate/3-hydroxycinnamic acid hydroxylase [Enhygromyxa salina]
MLEALIVGAGPVGLFLACRLASLGVEVGLLEARRDGSGDSRAIGVHAPALERLARMGLAERFLADGVRIERGHAFSSRGFLGSVDFTRAPGLFGCALSLPQSRTEALLEDALLDLQPSALRRGQRVVHVRTSARAASLTSVDEHGAWSITTARFVIGCDGKRSVVRRSIPARLRGGPRPGRYVMGDFCDDTSFGPDAILYLCDEGLVESFPLPGRRRRWVVEIDEAVRSPGPEQVVEPVARRTGWLLDERGATMVSAFGVEQRLTTRFHRGPLVLAGDAAHVVCPFGGQGMNLGWLDAWDLARTLTKVLREGHDADAALSAYARRRQRSARATARRAAINTRLGRRPSWPRARNAALTAALTMVPQALLAAAFSMRGIG